MSAAVAGYIVRYGAMRFLGAFTPTGGRKYRRGANVIARTDRGLEVGEILCEATETALKVLKDPPEGQIVREASAEDMRELIRIDEQARQEMDVCQGYVDKLRLQMKLVDVEHIFGGERVVIYYLAENRVDFRELVKLLAGEFQTRIEMRQIGVRDEAKLLADYCDCGVPVCCNTHLVQMPPVSMRMAKLQKATLDPTKISGRCGRLKCCLRYEFELYEQARNGAGNGTADGPAAGDIAPAGEIVRADSAEPANYIARATAGAAADEPADEAGETPTSSSTPSPQS